ncbi:MAG: response regulator [Rhodanobacteraceae bacterium]
MTVFGLFKWLVGKNRDSTGEERRADDRMRTSVGARVLVVDDSATIRAVLGKMLVQDRYEVLKAADGETAVEMARAQLPDLIFLDIVLPGMSGFSVLRALRRDASTRGTPIVMMSGNQQATEQFYVQRFGADGFLKKPFGRIEVFHTIRSLIQTERMPGRAVAPVLAAEIPAGISREEWEAIPSIALPDEAHRSTPTAAAVQPRPRPKAAVLASSPIMPRAATAPAVQAQPPKAPPVAVRRVPTVSPVVPEAPAAPPGPRVTTLVWKAFSMAMQPTVSLGLRKPAPAINAHVERPRQLVLDVVGDAAGATPATRGDSGD